MQVIQVARFGGPDVLVPLEIPDPVTGPGQAVIDVAAADLLFLDAMIRAGSATEFFPLRPPYVPGNGVAGTVSSIGAGTDASWIGRRVVAHTGENGASGGYAQRAVVKADHLVPVPEGLGFLEAAALLHDGATALGLVESFPVRPREWVLVVGASGGLGALLVQLARAGDARVIGAARGRSKLDLAREVGSDVVIEDSDPDWSKQVTEATGGAGVDLVFDNVGGSIGRAAFEATTAGGRFSAHGAPAGGFAGIDRHEAERLGVTVRGIEQVQFAPEDRVRLTAQALSDAAEGLIRPIVGQTFPLEQAADAHRAIEAREVIGKTLLVV
ncbi:MAG: zinc-binding dehydrogenase [Acidimicrobiales bacterium]